MLASIYLRIRQIDIVTLIPVILYVGPCAGCFSTSASGSVQYIACTATGTGRCPGPAASFMNRRRLCLWLWLCLWPMPMAMAMAMAMPMAPMHMPTYRGYFD